MLERRKSGRNLFYLTDKPPQCHANFFFGNCPVRLFDDIPFYILGIRFDTEKHGRTIGFVFRCQKLRQFCRLIEANRQHTGCHRIKRSGMTRLTRSQNLFHFAHDIMRSQARRFVNHHNTVHKCL
ncbi:MAG: hypothetical protein BWX99_02467 [Deltaproteobacteria bacterium ADurb.Bin151]|nr:MAG: hypothetical protein BWX99_02467 [Deltaproteobacteria bacterium ADurb.Bin151]